MDIKYKRRCLFPSKLCSRRGRLGDRTPELKRGGVCRGGEGRTMTKEFAGIFAVFFAERVKNRMTCTDTLRGQNSRFLGENVDLSGDFR